MHPLFFYRGVVAVTAMSFSILAAAQTKQEAVPVKVGDTWSYSVKNVLEPAKSQNLQTTAVEVNGNRWTGKVVGSLTGESSFERSQDWQVYKTVSPSSTREFKPSAQEFGFPLEAGKTFKSEGSFTNASGFVVVQRYEGKVIGTEKITVGADTLEAWIIESNGWWNSGNQSGRLSTKVWYSPQARAMVKVEFKRANAKGQPDENTLTEMTAFKLVD